MICDLTFLELDNLDKSFLLFLFSIIFLKEFKFLVNKFIALIILLLLKNISLHIISFEAAILEKSLKPPALY